MSARTFSLQLEKFGNLWYMNIHCKRKYKRIRDSLSNPHPVALGCCFLSETRVLQNSPSSLLPARNIQSLQTCLLFLFKQTNKQKTGLNLLNEVATG